MQTIEAHARVLLEETGLNMAMARPYARAPHGARAYASTPVNKGKQITLWGALSLDGISAAMTIAGRTDTEVLVTSVHTIVVPTWRPGPIVRMDTRSAPQDARLQTAIDSVGAPREYVPPSSPDFSPIAPCWSQVKAMLRATAARTRETLDAAITHA